MCTFTGLCQVCWLHWHGWGLLVLWRTERTNDGADIFDCLNGFKTSEGFQWDNCVGLCTDSAAAMTGKKSGLCCSSKGAGPISYFYPLFFTSRSPCQEETAPGIKRCVADTNAIKAGALSSWLFTSLCTEMGSEHQHLLLHAEVRWLSRVNVLTHLLELREEVSQFLASVNSPLAVHLSDEKSVGHIHSYKCTEWKHARSSIIHPDLYG